MGNFSMSESVKIVKNLITIQIFRYFLIFDHLSSKLCAEGINNSQQVVSESFGSQKILFIVFALAVHDSVINLSRR